MKTYIQRNKNSNLKKLDAFVLSNWATPEPFTWHLQKYSRLGNTAAHDRPILPQHGCWSHQSVWSLSRCAEGTRRNNKTEASFPRRHQDKKKKKKRRPLAMSTLRGNSAAASVSRCTSAVTTEQMLAQRRVWRRSQLAVLPSARLTGYISYTGSI